MPYLEVVARLLKVAILVAGSCLAACAPSNAEPSSVALPTVAQVPEICRGVGSGTVTIAGDPTDPRLAWEVGLDGGRQDDVWPPGYRARFTPNLEVLNASGRVVLRQGDRFPGGGCVAGPNDHPSSVIFINPEGPAPTPEDSRPCSAVSASLAAALPILEADLAAMVGGATDGATRNQLATDGTQTLSELNRHAGCYSAASLEAWRTDLDYLANPWRAAFMRVDAARLLRELEQKPLH